jgi:Glyoxalase-like domain
VSAGRDIDHLVVVVNDLTTARERYERLGFKTTPLGRHPWGTANHLVQFPRNFIELLGVVDTGELTSTSEDHFSFGAHAHEFLRRREGMCMLVLTTGDADADAEQWKARGLHAYPPFHWSRRATLPDGTETTVAFSLSFVVSPLMPELAFFSCQQHNPEAFWKPQYQQHANGARGVRAVTLVDEEPTRHAEFFSALLNDARMEISPESLTMHCGHGEIRVQSPRAFAARYPAARPAGQGVGAALRAASIEVTDLNRVARCLADKGIIHARSDSAIQLGEDQCCGLVLEFVPAPA